MDHQTAVVTFENARFVRRRRMYCGRAPVREDLNLLMAETTLRAQRRLHMMAHEK
jgi:hypothetical protein